jgi:hypothetical protein
MTPARARQAALLAAWLLSTPATALAATSQYAFNDVPSRFYTLELTTGARALGELCLSREIMPDGTVCNPAFLPYVKESSLMARFYLGNGYTALSTANHFVNQPLTREFLQSYFTENQTTSLEAHAGLVFTTRYFSAAFSPYRVQYLSEGHNPNFPVMGVHAANERSIVFSGGYALEEWKPELKGWSVGGKLKILERTFVHGSFSFFQAASEDPKDFLPVQNQTAILLDTFVAWKPRKAPWPMRATLSVKNLGAIWPKSPLYPEYTDLGAGFGVDPPLGFGTLRLGLDIVDLFYAPDFPSRLRFGAGYQVGVLELMAGASGNALSAGMQFSFQIVKAGIVYELIRTDLDRGGGRGSEDQIATEIALHI